jgi:hypothetical protein
MSGHQGVGSTALEGSSRAMPRDVMLHFAISTATWPPQEVQFPEISIGHELEWMGSNVDDLPCSAANPTV